MITDTIVIVKNADTVHAFSATTQGVTDAAAAFTVGGVTARATLGAGITVPVSGTLQLVLTPAIVANLPEGPGDYDVITRSTGGGTTLVARGRIIVRSGRAEIPEGD